MIQYPSSVNPLRDGQFIPEFAAYTKLTLVNRFQNERKGGSLSPHWNSMTFQQFMDALQNEKSDGVHTGSVPPEEEETNRFYLQQNGESLFARKRFEAIERAYQLGLVDVNGVLKS
ncbi:hypothetical protein [Paenibacillus sp. GbtcB18]|uniref:hypothetical protein n=1 Tax=Paenibacillus sp. GbtcB18 TaxID=2824763 RepID=UPI001C304E81|nr:hypothetical protein [Paenibacillus sp. GbtcB18]